MKCRRQQGILHAETSVGMSCDVVENWTESVTWMFLTPHELNFELLKKNSKKENEKECVKAVLYIVILEYSLYSKLSCCIRFIQMCFLCLKSRSNGDDVFFEK